MASPLVPRTVSINFAQGIDTKTDQKLTTKLTTAENVVLRKNGTIEKRPGFVSHGTYALTNNPIKAIPFNDGLAAITNSSNYTTSNPQTGDQRGWQKIVPRVGSSFTAGSGVPAINAYLACSVRTMPFVADVGSVTVMDGCIAGASVTLAGTAHLVFASSVTNAGRAFDIDFRSSVGFPQAAPGGAATAPAIRAVTLTASSLTAYTFGVGDGSQTVVVKAVPLGSPSSVTVSSFDLGANTPSNVPPQLDVVAVGGRFYFVSNPSGTQMVLGSFNPATSATSVTTIPASITPAMITFATPASGTDRVHLVWATSNTSGTALYASYSVTLSQIQAATTITICAALNYGNLVQIGACENIGATTVRVYGTMNSVTTMPPITQYGMVSLTGSAIFTAGQSVMRGTLAAKPFLANTVPTVILHHSQTGQQSLVVASEIPNLHVATARALYGISGPNSGTYVNLPSVAQNLQGLFYVPARRANFFAANAGTVTVAYGGELVELNFSQSQSLGFVALPGATYVGGGFLTEFDGATLDAGFLSYPTINTVAVTTTGGSLTIGTYSTLLVKEYVDQAGVVHFGQPSTPVTFTCSTTTSAATVHYTDSIPTLKSITFGARFVAYRTQANQSIFYRDTSAVVSGLDVVSATARTLSLTVADTSASGGSAVYTTGGALPHWTPDSCRVLFAHGVRLFCEDPTDETALRYSNELNSGEAPAFVATNIIRMPGKGRITAGASLDSNGIVFRARSILAFGGNGPDDTGRAGSFSDGQTLYPDVGCIDQRNLCRFRDGIIFKSPDKGFYLLTRDLQLQYVGQDVEAYNSKTVVSSEVVGLAEADGTAEECRFLCSDGTLLVYNYYNGQWTTSTLTGCVDAVQSGGRYLVVNTSTTAPSARVFQQSLSTYTDDFMLPGSVTYQMTVETGWIKTADVQGFQRVWKVSVLGEAHGPGKFTVEVGYDYEAAYNETYTATMSSLTAANYTGGQTAAPQADFVPVRQKCQAIRFRIKDIPDAGGGAVVKLTNISLLCGVKKGLFKLPASKGI